MNIPREELKKISYLDVPDEDARAIPLQPCYHGEENWESWVTGPDGLHQIKMEGLVEGIYFGGEEPYEEGDIHLLLAGLVVKHFYFPKVATHFRHLLEAVYNLSTNIAKIDLFWENHEDDDRISRRFVTSELEFLIQNCRSVFDYLQELVRDFNDNTDWLGHNPNPLPTNFAKVALQNGEPAPKEHIVQKYNLPEPLADFYINHADFFAWLRSARNEIVHDGQRISPLFPTDRGFALLSREKPFSKLDIWNDSNLKQPNDLGSVRALYGHLAHRTLFAIEDFAQLIAQILQLPPDVASEHHVWVRGEHLERIQQPSRYLGDQAWYKNT